MDLSDTKGKSREPLKSNYRDLKPGTHLSAGDTITEFPAARLIARKEYQGRTAINPQRVSVYAEQYCRGSDGPPLQVAYYGGMWFIIDGFHRKLALIEAGYVHAPSVEVVAISRTGAFARASMANLNHGVPLTGAAYKKLLVQYIAGGRHIIQRRKQGVVIYKSFEAIAADFNHIRSASTYRRWIQKGHPSVYWRMVAGEEPLPKFNGSSPSPTVSDTPQRVCRDALLQALETTNHLPEKHDLLALAEQVVSALATGGPTKHKLLDGSDQSPMDEDRDF